MSDPKFVDGLPGGSPKSPGRPPTRILLVEKLRANPGQWAEVARYDRGRRGTAAARGQQFQKQFPDVEQATRTVGDEVVLYLRAVTA